MDPTFQIPIQHFEAAVASKMQEIASARQVITDAQLVIEQAQRDADGYLRASVALRQQAGDLANAVGPGPVPAATGDMGAVAASGVVLVSGPVMIVPPG